MSATILVIEDEASIRSMLRYVLTMRGYQVLEAQDVKQAHHFLSLQRPDLVLLDWMLPQTNGIMFLKQLKQSDASRDIPVIMLTAKAEEDNKVFGLEQGADDYMVKPFSPRELVARVQAVLRRGPLRNADATIRVGDIVIDTAGQRVYIAHHLVRLGRLEYRLLCFFVKNRDRVYSRDQLLSHVWGSHAYVDERTVDVHVRRLRKQLKPFGYDQLIQTVHGSGYRFSEKYYD